MYYVGLDIHTKRISICVLSETGQLVRQLVAEAACQARRRSPTVRAYFERVQRGEPPHRVAPRLMRSASTSGSL
jgi:hypothetical protein